MRQIVEKAYRQWLTLPDDWTPQQRETFLQDLTRRLDRRAAQIADDLAAAAIKEWTARHGQHPDYLTTVGLRNTAMTSAREMVINQELYDQIPEPNDDQDVIDYDALPSRGSRPTKCRGTSGGTTPIPQRTGGGPRGPRGPGVARPGLFDDVPDQSGIPADRPQRGRPAAADRARRPAGSPAGGPDLRRPARRRVPRPVEPESQLSLFDSFDQPTDPRIIDPGGSPLPPARRSPAPPELPTAPEDQAALPAARRLPGDSAQRCTPHYRPDSPRSRHRSHAGGERTRPEPPGQIAAPSTNDVPAINPATPPAAPTPTVIAEDFPASTDVLVPSGAKARARANIAAIELVHTLRDAQRAASPEQRILAAWSGWGAIPQVFDPRNEDFTTERAQLAGLSPPSSIVAPKPPSSTPTTPTPRWRRRSGMH